jgi:hypothetical protein
MKIVGSRLDLLALGTSVTIFLNHIYYSTIADLHNLQPFYTNLLSLFPLVFTICFLETNL